MSRERTCQTCGSLPGVACLTPAGKVARQDHGARGWEQHLSPRGMERERLRNNRRNLMRRTA